MNNSAIQEFKQIYKKEVGIELSDADAEKKAIELINLFKIIFRGEDEAL